MQGWNQDYAAARKIFSRTISAAMIRGVIQHEHERLYDKRNHMSGKYGRYLVEGLGDLLARIGYKNSDAFIGSTSSHTPRNKNYVRSNSKGHDDSIHGRAKKYTYSITPEDSQLCFSETAVSHQQIGQDFLSKHALHAKAAYTVVYAGEFFVDSK